jgi:hypothetical protein
MYTAGEVKYLVKLSSQRQSSKWQSDEDEVKKNDVVQNRI